MKKTIYVVIALFMLPVFAFTQKAKWQKTSDGRMIFIEKVINHPTTTVTKSGIQDKDDLNRKPVSGSVYYIRAGEPWGVTTNIDLLNEVFGRGNYIVAKYYNVDPNTVFSGSTSIVFLEGSDFNSLSLRN